MLKFNNKVLHINDKWLNPNGAPVPPPSGQWYTLFEGQYGDMTWYDMDSFTKASTYIETNTKSTITYDKYCYIYVYKALSIPEERQDDDYLLIEFPYFPWRASRVANTVLNGNANTFYMNIVNQYDWDTKYINYMFNLWSYALTYEVNPNDQDFGVLDWRTTLSIPNVSYTNTFEHIQHSDRPYTSQTSQTYLRLLIDKHNGKLYLNHWDISNLPSRIRISDFVDTGYTVNITDTCIIYLYSGCIGRDATSSNPNNYLTCGYASPTNDIKFKSYKGTL